MFLEDNILSSEKRKKMGWTPDKILKLTLLRIDGAMTYMTSKNDDF